jgi:hypothetical protein
MTEGPVHFTLDDGETLTIDGGDVGPLYDLLWQLAPKPGAVSAAAILHAASLQSEYTRPTYQLTAAQGTVVLEALSLLSSRPGK